MAEEKWAPLVYARTLKVDFRFIAMPKGVDDADLDWLRDCIHGSTVFADELRETTRFTLFQNERYRVFGMTGMASLLGDHSTVGSRELYLFAGYVAARRTAEPAYASVGQPVGRLPGAGVPPLDGLNRAPYRVFRPLYRHVQELWRDERVSLETEDREAISYGFEVVPEISRAIAEHPVDPRRLPDSSSLNLQDSQLRLFPHTDAEAVWLDAIHNSQPHTLCLGLPNATAALRTTFFNASVVTLARRQDIDRSIGLVIAPDLHDVSAGGASRSSGDGVSFLVSTGLSKSGRDSDVASPASDLEQRDRPRAAGPDGSSREVSSGGSVSESRPGLGRRLIGSLFGRRSRPVKDLSDVEAAEGTEPHAVSPDSEDVSDNFIRRWHKGEDPDGWIDYEKSP